MMNSVCPNRNDLLSIAMAQSEDVSASAEIERHLLECETCRKQMDRLLMMVTVMRQTASHHADTAVSAATPAPNASDARPSSLGKYLVVGEIGRGGQARVFRALHPTLGRDVAIKWSHHPLESDARDRLAREGKLLAGLDHPGILRVFDLDVQQGRPFLVMEYARGCDLEQYASREKITPTRAAELTAKVGRALAAAHHSGVIHQDIKPANILIDDKGEPRLSDFGIAQLRDLWDKSDEQPEGGTLGYMAPEQLPGGSVDIGPASDIYALGGVLYFLLTSKEPRQLSENPAVAWEQVRTGKINWTPLERSECPRSVKEICRKALSADPKQRFGSADDFANALEQTSVRKPLIQRSSFRGAVAAALLLLVGTIWFQRPAATAVIPNPAPKVAQFADPFRVSLLRDKKLNPLKGREDFEKSLPLRAGDKLRLALAGPEKMQMGLYGITLSDAQFKIRDMGPLVFQEGRFQLPTMMSLDGSPATELLLVCGSEKSRPTADELSAILVGLPWLEVSRNLASLPENLCFAFDSEKVDEPNSLSRIGQLEKDPIFEMVNGLDQVRKKLRERYPFAAGLTFTQVAQAGAAEDPKRSPDPVAAPADNPAADADTKLFNEVMEKLLATARVKNQYPDKYVWPPRYYVIPNSDKQFNAYAGPEGYDPVLNKTRVRCIMTRGYLEKIVQGNPEICAAIMGHEVAHILKGHVGLTKEDRQDLIMLAFNREQEIDADLEGVQIAVAAGFPWQAGIRSAFREQKFLGDISNFEGIRATHPSWNDRLQFLDRKEPEIWKAMAEFQNGFFFLNTENYRTAEICFDKVVREFPNCAEGWANLGYARLMQYCDGLDSNDLRKLGIGQFAVGAFYVRPQSLVPTRASDKELWEKAVGALTMALKKDDNLTLPRVNLALAYLVHYDGKPMANKALEYFAQTQNKNDKGIDAYTQAAYLINLGVAQKAAGDLANAQLSFADAAKILPKQSSQLRDYLEDSLLYNQGVLNATRPERVQKKLGADLLTVYLQVSSPSSSWWPLAFEKYEAVCRELGQTPLDRKQLATRKAEQRFRLVTTLDVAPGKSVTLSDSLNDTLKTLGREKTVGLPVVAYSKINRYNSVVPGVSFLGDSKILAIFLTTPEAPPIYVQGKGTGAEKVALRVGMPLNALIAALQDPPVERRPIGDRTSSYLFMPHLGLGVRIENDRVAELVLAQVPRKE